MPHTTPSHRAKLEADPKVALLESSVGNLFELFSELDQSMRRLTFDDFASVDDEGREIDGPCVHERRARRVSLQYERELPIEIAWKPGGAGSCSRSRTCSRRSTRDRSRQRGPTKCCGGPSDDGQLTLGTAVS
jgi:hypothetical protein